MERGWAAAGCSRGGRRLGRPVWLAWLPPARFLLFFLKTFSFSFLVLKELEKKGFRIEIFMEIIFIKQPFQSVLITNIFGSEIFKIQRCLNSNLNLAKMV